MHQQRCYDVKYKRTDALSLSYMYLEQQDGNNKKVINSVTESTKIVLSNIQSPVRRPLRSTPLLPL